MSACHGSAIPALFTEVLYAGWMVLDLMLQIYVMSLPRSAIIFKEVWYANCMVIGLLLQFRWCSAKSLSNGLIYIVSSHFHCRLIQYQFHLHHLCWHLLSCCRCCHLHYPVIQFNSIQFILAVADVFAFVFEPHPKVWLSFLPTN
jgi:hypothetical protein